MNVRGKDVLRGYLPHSYFIKRDSTMYVLYVDMKPRENEEFTGAFSLTLLLHHQHHFRPLSFLWPKLPRKLYYIEGKMKGRPITKRKCIQGYFPLSHPCMVLGTT